jgi:predicted transcriptional regulator
MEIQLTPEQSSQFARLAASEGREVSALTEEAINRYLAEEARFIEAVTQGEAQLDRGEFVSHAELGGRLDRLFRS